MKQTEYEAPGPTVCGVLWGDPRINVIKRGFMITHLKIMRQEAESGLIKQGYRRK